MRFGVLPILSVFAGGLVYAVLPRGAFGTYDVASRAVVTGAAAGLTCVLILMQTRRRERPRR